VKFPALTKACRPQTQLLGQAAVVGHGPGAERQAEVARRPLQVHDHGGDFFGSSTKEVFQGLAFLGGFLVEWEGAVANIYLIFLLQFFNTPGNEIAPGSDIIGKDIELQS
jgi:hypothetical protein